MSLDPRPSDAELLRRHAEQQAPPLTLVASSADAERQAHVLEKAEQAVIRKMAIAVGFKVYNLSQSRAAKQTPGLPDLWLAHYDRGFAGWWETKRQIGGKLSTAQLDFMQECRRAGVMYGTGDRHHFAEVLRDLGIDPPTPR